MDHSTKEALAAASLSEEPMSTYELPHGASFQLSPEELEQIRPSVIKRRNRLKGSWSSLFREKLITPYTTWNFTDSTYSAPDSRQQNTCLLRAKGYCAETYCDVTITIHADKLDPYTMLVNISGRLGKAT